MRHFIFFFPFTLFLLASSLVFGQTNVGQLSVQVQSNKGEFIEFSNLRLFSKADSSAILGGYSDEKGRIEIKNIPLGAYYGVITFFGFEDYYTKSLEISNKNLKVNLGTVYLTPIQSQEFEEVVIVGKEKALMESSIDKRTYNVDKDMTSIGGDVTDVLNNIPSVEVDNDGNVSLRGNGSVTILIDGRESVLSSGDGALNGIPASAIERIEVVTNPSAKYNPEGTAGVINIVLKKQQLRGFNGNVQLTAATRNLYNISTGFNLRREKFNLFGNYSFRYAESAANTIKRRVSTASDTTETILQDRIGANFSNTHTANIGMDFFLKENQVLGLSASGSFSDRDLGALQKNRLLEDDAMLYYWNRDISELQIRRSMDFNANYKLDFKDGNGNLMVTATESLGDRDFVGDYEELYYDSADDSPISDRNRTHKQNKYNTNSKFTLNADLVRSINEKMKYETGLEARINRLNETNFVEFFDTVTQQIIPDESANDELIYNENIFSAYGVFAHDVAKLFKYQVGLRLEQAFINPEFLASNQTFKYQYFNFFPSVHLVFGDDDKGRYFASYSRRINRPSPWNLNPFSDYDDPLNLRVGNPALRPEFINSIEIGYDKGWEKGSIMGTVYFKQIQNKIQGIMLYTEDGIGIRTFDNIDDSYEYGAEAIVTYSPFSWWRNMVSFNAYESRLSANVQGVQLSSKGINWDVKLNMTFSLFNNTTNIQINGQYMAPRQTVQGTFHFNRGFDIGITRSLLNKNIVIGLKLSDIFNQRGFKMVSDVNGISQSNSFKRTSRRLHFTLSYKFGNLKAKEKPMVPNFEGGGGDMME